MGIIKKTILLLVVSTSFLQLTSTMVANAGDGLAQSDYFKVEILDMVAEKELQSGGIEYEFKAVVLSSDMEGEEIIVSNTQTGSYTNTDYQKGDKIMVSSYTNSEGETVFYALDHIRDTKIYILGGIFFLTIFIIGKTKGVRAILSLGLSCFVIFYFLIPKILTGANPVIWTIIYCSMFTIGSMYLVYGINRKSTIALAGMLFGITAVGILSVLFSGFTHLAGFTQEEVIYLIDQMEMQISLKGIMLSGFIIGGLGVLDDITVGQVSAVMELMKANKKLRGYELYKSAMVVGTDHLAAMINSLFLAYAGTAFPLLLILSVSGNNADMFGNAINNESIATEVVRTLVGSMGLILALPVTTLFATYFCLPEKTKQAM